MTLEPLFSMASSTWPAGNSFFETSHVSSVAVTLTTRAPSPLPSLFSVQPVTAVRAATVATAVTTDRRAGRTGSRAGSKTGHERGRHTIG